MDEVLPQFICCLYAVYMPSTLISGQTQLEDPCMEWRRRQQEMLSEYLVSANDQLQVGLRFQI